MDKYYYKKNTQLRYQISRELDIYNQKKEKAEHKKPNLFIAPVFSAVMTILISSQEKEEILKTENIIRIIVSACLFFIIYELIRIIIIPLWNKLMFWLKQHLFPLNKQTFTDIENVKQCEQFNYDIMNLVYLTYITCKECISNDDNIKKYNQSEILFYISRLNYKLGKIFKYNNVNIALYIQNFRVRVAFEIFREILTSIKSDPYFQKDEICNVLKNEINSYNGLVDVVNTLYCEKCAEELV